MKQRGFTIVEMIVVVAIIGLLAAITVFAFGTWRERTAASQMTHEIGSANDAITHYANFNNAFPATNNDVKTLYTQDTQLTTTYTLRSGGASYCLMVQDMTGAGLATLYYDSLTKQTSTTVCS